MGALLHCFLVVPPEIHSGFFLLFLHFQNSSINYLIILTLKIVSAKTQSETSPVIALVKKTNTLPVMIFLTFGIIHVLLKRLAQMFFFPKSSEVPTGIYSRLLMEFVRYFILACARFHPGLPWDFCMIFY